MTGVCPPEDSWLEEAETDLFLFRDVRARGTHTHWPRMNEEFATSGRRYMPSAASNRYRLRIRAIMRHVVGLPKDLEDTYGCQSGRSGGCTHYAHLGVPEDQRMAIGQ